MTVSASTLTVTVIIRRFYAGVNPQRFFSPKIAQLNGSFITLSAFLLMRMVILIRSVIMEKEQNRQALPLGNAGSAKEDWLVRGARARFARGVKDNLASCFAGNG